MGPGLISKRVVLDRLVWLEQMQVEIKNLPLKSKEQFSSDTRNVWAAESCLRRSLEALFDLGRHILVKGFAEGTTEYKEIAQKLADNGVLSSDTTGLLLILAGYRNRLVHYYHEVTLDELFDICAHRMDDIEVIQSELKTWLRQHPEKLDETL